MKGISAVAAQEIATGAGVSTATLYRWWETKEALMFDACFEHVMRFYLPRRQIQLEVIEEAVACGELKRDTDPELLLDALSGPYFFDGCKATLQPTRSLLEPWLTKSFPRSW